MSLKDWYQGWFALIVDRHTSDICIAPCTLNRPVENGVVNERVMPANQELFDEADKLTSSYVDRTTVMLLADTLIFQLI
jgi:hypothetical protein